MPRYIDANELVARFNRLIKDDWNRKTPAPCWSDAFEEATDIVDEVATADVVEVVRCRKCKSSEYTRMCSFGEVYCTWHGCFMHEDGFCSDGEREEKDDG